MASTTFVDGETLIEASWLNDVNAAIYNPAAAVIPASSIVNTPNTGAGGSITATNVQAALNELDTEKVAVASIGTTVQAWDAQLDALALLSTGTASGNIPLVGTASATDTLAGLVELATAGEVAAGVDTSRAVTPAGLAASVLGVGQTWQNVLASRAITTSYTNDTGRPILVSVSLQSNTTGAGVATASALVGAVTVQTAQIEYYWSSTVVSMVNSLCFVVPAGSTYSITTSHASTLTVWAELR